MFQMLDLDPSKRGTAVELLNHAFLKNKSKYDKNDADYLKKDWEKYIRPKTDTEGLIVLENILNNIKVHCGACAIFSENAVNQLAKGLQLSNDEVYNEFIAAGMKIEEVTL